MSRPLVRKIAVFAAIALFCVLFWFLSPAISVSGMAIFSPAWVRLLIVVLILSTWLAVEGVAWWRHGKRDKAMASSLQQDAAGAANGSREDIREMDEKFRRALKLLRERRFGGDRQRLYQLPWYLVIGPPGSGKTTWIRNSGLRFPLADAFGDDRIQGVGGTRTCDWWFTEDAVMLDTAGRFSTQDSDQAADSASWMGLLDSLRRHRSRRPLDGVIVMFSIAELMAQTPEQIVERGRRLNRRLAEIGERVGTRFPVYLVFTKADLVAGFTEYFDDLTREERDQVWGATLPLDAGAEMPRRVEAAMDQLLGRLDERLLSRLHDEKDPRRDALVHGFPFQFASLKPVIRDLIGEIWRPAAYGESPVMARGVYFSSGTQEGNPFDRILRVIARDFGLSGGGGAPSQGSKRSFFIARVLKDVIFPEAGLVGNTGFIDRYRTWIQRTLIFGSAVLLLAFAVLFYFSYTGNRATIAQASVKADAARKIAAVPIDGETALVALLPALDALRDFPSGFARGAEPVPAGQGFGLHQGEAYGGAARDAYVDALNRAFQPALMRDLAAALGGETDPGRRYRALKLYLMLGTREHLDGQFMAAAAAGVARERYGELRPEAAASLRAHAQALADPALAGAFRKAAMDRALVEQVRRELSDMDPAAQVYQSLSQSLADTELPPWRLRDYVSGAEKYFVTDGRDLAVPALFTRKGYAELFLKNAPEAVTNAAAESWVLGGGEGRPGAYDHGRLMEGVTRLYFQDYRQTWTDLINGLQLQQPGASGLRAFVTRMSDRDSPLRQALVAIAAELSFSSPATDKAATLLKDKTGQLGAVLAGATGAEALDPRKAVSAEFADLINLTRGPKPPLDETLAQLKEFATALRDMERTGDAGALQNAVDTLRDDARGQPAPFDGWLDAVAGNGQQAFIKGSGERVSSAWSGGSGKKCAAINGRFPFQSGARDDVNLADFADVFGYGGLLDGFFNEQIKAQVDQSGASWRWRNPEEAPSLPAEALGMFQRADEIRRAFFRQGSNQPRVEFQITSRRIDSRATNATLVLGGRTLVFRPNVPSSYKVVWPLEGDSETAYLVFIRGDGGGMTNPQPYDGPWSVFRLFAGHLSQAGSRDRYRLILDKDGLQAEFELKALSVDNPFALRLDRFRCLGSL